MQDDYNLGVHCLLCSSVELSSPVHVRASSNMHMDSTLPDRGMEVTSLVVFIKVFILLPSRTSLYAPDVSTLVAWELTRLVDDAAVRRTLPHVVWRPPLRSTDRRDLIVYTFHFANVTLQGKP